MVIVHEDEKGLQIVCKSIRAIIEPSFDFNNQRIAFMYAGDVKNEIGILLVLRFEIDMAALVNLTVERKPMMFFHVATYLVIELIAENALPNYT